MELSIDSNNIYTAEFDEYSFTMYDFISNKGSTIVLDFDDYYSKYERFYLPSNDESLTTNEYTTQPALAEHTKIGEIRNIIDEIKKEINELRNDLNDKIDELRNGLNGTIDKLHDDLMSTFKEQQDQLYNALHDEIHNK